MFLVSIDEHPMWVYAADGRYVEPQEVEVMILRQHAPKPKLTTAGYYISSWDSILHYDQA